MNNLTRAVCSIILAASFNGIAKAEITTVNNHPYLLSLSKDMSADFNDLSNIYFLADSLAEFDISSGEGKILWKRHQLMTRQAFNTNTFLLQPLKSLDFPDTAYPQDPELDFSITPINENTLRIRIRTAKHYDKSDSSIMLVKTPVKNLDGWKVTRAKNGDVTYASSQGSVTIEADPWRIVISDAEGKPLTQTRTWSDNDSTQVKVQPFSFIKRGSDNSRSINPVFSIAPGEKIYGLGESATALNKVGQKLNLFVTDPQGPETPDMYKPIPFFFSNRGYGIFMHSSEPITMDLGQSYIGANKIFMSDEDMDFFVFFGTPKQILSEYTELTGRPNLPPLWSFGTWMSRISYFTEQEGRDVANKLRENKIPSDVIHFDTGWFDVDWECDYEFSKDRFKNPQKMIDDLKKQGFHISLWQIPYFVPGNRYYPELIEKELYVKNGKGTLPYEDVVLDFTNPETVAWYQDKIGKLISMGVGAIKVDFGEAAPINAVYHNGKTGWQEHNLYPLRYNKAVADITKQTSGEDIIWARAAWAGSQRYPLHWGGDAATTSAGMLGTVREGLSFGLSGFPFWSHDIGGFVTDTPEELYRRWLPMGFLTSHSRAHGAPPTEPWLFDNPEFTNYFRKAAELKYALMPYVVQQAEKSANNGWPMFRALLLEFPDDPGAWNVEDQYLFGEDILVAPLLEPGDSRDVYLPGGIKWIDYQTGQTYQPGWNRVTVPADALQAVILVRDGATIPHVPVAQSTSQIDWNAVYDKTYKAD
ncbi:MAG: alpha-xylosidase [Muribaculaceae bacterium]|nr:alpha-xylosidase [Muribaculaceae bacterium]